MIDVSEVFPDSLRSEEPVLAELTKPKVRDKN